MIEDNGVDVILATSNPDEVLSYIEHQRADCFFIDIDLKHSTNGMDLATRIRQEDPICSIVFVTTHSEMSFLTFIYKIAALDFIIKDDFDMLKSRLLSTLQEAYSRYQKIGEQTTVKKLQIKVLGQTRNIDYQDIYFFEASPNLHKIILHLANEQIEFYGRLKSYEELSDEFYRCHKSFIVNKTHIETIDTKTRLITMTNGGVCFASNRLIKGLLS